MQVLEQTTKVLGENSYLITALDTTYGLNVLSQLTTFQINGQSPTADFIKQVVLKSVTVNNMQATEAWFNKYFSRKYTELYELFAEIQKFNFGSDEEEDSPNEQGDTSEV